jgi:DNA-binding protein H-NS
VHSELNTNIENSISAIKEKADKDRENFNNQFEKVSKAIATVDSKIVKEDDLTELFQNYTLNVNISGNEKPKKRKFLK